MAHPWVFESNFEGGSNAEWDSETDTGSKLDFPHYSELARFSPMGMPYRGAYCMRVVCGDTNDHTLTEGDIDIADAATRYFRFYLYIGQDFAATADDSFNILELQQADGTRECSMGLRITAATDAVEIGIGDGTAPSSYATSTLSKGEWHCIEWKVLISTGGTGTQDLYIDGSASVVALTTLTNAAAVAQGVFGTQDTLSTTTGTLLFDQFVMDDARIYPFRDRWPSHINLQKTQHVFVGPGDVDGLVILTSTSGDNIKLYDTDTANVLDEESYITEIDANGQTSMSGPVHFERGCYAVVTGSSTEGVIYLNRGSDKPGVRGPVYYGSEGSIRRYGLLRKPRPQNV